jgi:hypothetical protein
VTVIFSTIHGSRLYGFNHAGSDEDQYIVFEEKISAKQSVSGKDDILRTGLHDFLDKAFSGSHQSLEALMSQEKVYEAEEYRPFLENARVPAAGVRVKYIRTIKKFCFEDFKRRRHAVRLGYNLADLYALDGRFNPRLSDERIDDANLLADSHWGLDLLRNIESRIESPSTFA